MWLCALVSAFPEEVQPHAGKKNPARTPLVVGGALLEHKAAPAASKRSCVQCHAGARVGAAAPDSALHD